MEDERTPLSDYALPLPDKDTFKSAPPETKMLYLYDLQCITLENQRKVFVALEKRQKIDDKQHRYQKYISSCSGFVGGFLAVLGSKILKYEEDV